MFQQKKIICIIPAREGSVGLKNKNIKKINNKPLIYWPIIAAKKSKLIDTIMVTTDSKKIQKIVKNYKVDCPFLRPKKISGNNSKISESIIHALKFYKEKKFQSFDYILLLEPTSPLTDQIDIDKALKIIIKNSKIDSLVAVTKNLTSHPQFNFKLSKKNYLKNFLNLKSDVNRQDVSNLFYLSGNLYISKISSFFKTRSFIQKKTFGYVVNKWKASEIDDLVDFIKTESIMKYKKIK